MVLPPETASAPSRSRRPGLAILASAGVLCLGTPLTAQDAADDVGNVTDPQGEPGDPLPDAPSVSTAPRPSDAQQTEDASRADPDPELGTAPASSDANELLARDIGEIDFEADILSFDSDADIITASGNVVLRSGDRSLRADTVSWNRATGTIMAGGCVSSMKTATSSIRKASS